MSFDGNVIVGEADIHTKRQLDIDAVFRWTQETGMESVEELLHRMNLLPPSWILDYVHAMTPNGIALRGTGWKADASTLYEEGEYLRGRKGCIEHVWRAVIPRGNLF